MSTVHIALCSIALVLLFSASAFAQGTYAQLDVPGATATYGYGVNDNGDVSGSFQDAAGFHGFLFSGGTYTILNYPGGSDTTPQGINDMGQIVGYARLNSHFIGFLYDIPTASYTEINYPGSTATDLTCINNDGTMGGSFLSSTGLIGFELANSTYTMILPTNAVSSSVLGITDTAEFVGFASTSTSKRFFQLKNNRYSYLKLASLPGPFIADINFAGTALTGYYSPSHGQFASFLYQNATATTIQFPGSTQTYAYGVNNAGDVSGYFIDSAGAYHAFTWTLATPAERK
jgi:uncharacterized membrane protein